MRSRWSELTVPVGVVRHRVLLVNSIQILLYLPYLLSLSTPFLSWTSFPCSKNNLWNSEKRMVRYRRCAIIKGTFLFFPRISFVHIVLRNSPERLTWIVISVLVSYFLSLMLNPTLIALRKIQTNDCTVAMWVTLCLIILQTISVQSIRPATRNSLGAISWPDIKRAVMIRV